MAAGLAVAAVEVSVATRDSASETVASIPVAAWENLFPAMFAEAAAGLFAAAPVAVADSGAGFPSG